MIKNYFILFSILFYALTTLIKAGDLSFANNVSIGVTYSVYVDNEYAYVTNNDGLSIISIQDPYNSVLVGSLSIGVSFGIAIENKVAYIAVNSGVTAADISDPQNIKILSEYDLSSVTHRLVVKKNSLFVSSDLGMDILDIINPSKMKHLSHFHHNKLRSVGIFGKTAYLASYNKGIEVVDVSDQTYPQHITFLDSTIGAWDIDIHDEYLYVGRHAAGISIFNINDSKSPKYLSSYWDNDNGEAQGVWGNGQYLFIADNYGIEVLNIKDPNTPIEIADYMNISAAHDIYVNSGFVYAATGSNSFLILKYH